MRIKYAWIWSTITSAVAPKDTKEKIVLKKSTSVFQHLLAKMVPPAMMYWWETESFNGHLDHITHMIFFLIFFSFY